MDTYDTLRAVRRQLGPARSWSSSSSAIVVCALRPGAKAQLRRGRAHPPQETIRGLTTMATKIEKDDITGTATTGHEWDGIKELNTPLPRWWL